MNLQRRAGKNRTYDSSYIMSDVAPIGSKVLLILLVTSVRRVRLPNTLQRASSATKR